MRTMLLRTLLVVAALAAPAAAGSKANIQDTIAAGLQPPGSMVTAMEHSNGRIMTAGNFTSILINGISTPVKGIAIYTIATNTWAPICADYPLGTVWDFAQNRVDGSWYACGEFNKTDTNTQLWNIARLNPSTNRWEPLHDHLAHSSWHDLNGACHGLDTYITAEYPTNMVVVGGNFSDANGVNNTDYLAQFNSSSGEWSTPVFSNETRLNDTVNDVLAFRDVGATDYQIWVGGKFGVEFYDFELDAWFAFQRWSGIEVNALEYYYDYLNPNETTRARYVYVAGKFDIVMNHESRGLARFNLDPNVFSGEAALNTTGNVYALGKAGHKLFMAGEFPDLSPSNMGWFDMSTGQFTAQQANTALNGEILTVASDDTWNDTATSPTVFIGGSFSAVVDTTGSTTPLLLNAGAVFINPNVQFPTPSPSPSPSVSPSVTASPSVSSSVTASPSRSSTPSPTATVSTSPSFSPSVTPSPPPPLVNGNRYAVGFVVAVLAAIFVFIAIVTCYCCWRQARASRQAKQTTTAMELKVVATIASKRATEGHEGNAPKKADEAGKASQVVVITQ